MPRQTTNDEKRNPSHIVGVMLAVSVSIWMTGCYEHVVRAEGSSARGRTIHEPALSEERTVIDDLEDAVMGPKRRPARR